MKYLNKGKQFIWQSLSILFFIFSTQLLQANIIESEINRYQSLLDNLTIADVKSEQFLHKRKTYLNKRLNGLVNFKHWLNNSISLDKFVETTVEFNPSIIVIGEFHGDPNYIHLSLTIDKLKKRIPALNCFTVETKNEKSLKQYWGKFAKKAKSLSMKVIPIDLDKSVRKYNELNRLEKMNLRDEYISKEISNLLINKTCNKIVHLGGLGHITRNEQHGEEFSQRDNLVDRLKKHGVSDYILFGIVKYDHFKFLGLNSKAGKSPIKKPKLLFLNNAEANPFGFWGSQIDFLYVY